MLLKQSNHTTAYLPVGSNKPTIISKRDLGHTVKRTNEPCCSRDPVRRTMATQNKLPLQDEMLTRGQVPANQETCSESSDSVTEIAYFPPLPGKKTVPKTHQQPIMKIPQQ